MTRVIRLPASLPARQVGDLACTHGDWNRARRHGDHHVEQGANDDAECGMLTARAHLWYTLPPAEGWAYPLGAKKRRQQCQNHLPERR